MAKGRPSGKFVYRVAGKKGAYLNITNKCSLNCPVCDRSGKHRKLQERVGADLILEREPGVKELLKHVAIEVEHGRPTEFVFCGLGEPTARLNEVLTVAKELKKRFPDVKIRLNTNGHACILNPAVTGIPQKLKEAGVDAVSVSINATSAGKYNRLHKPGHKFREKAFYAALDFAKACQLAGIETKITFIKYPDLNVKECEKFAKEHGLTAEFRELVS